LNDEEHIKLLSKSTQLLHDAYSGTYLGGKVPSAIEDFHDALVSFSYGLNPNMLRTIMEAVNPDRYPRVVNILEHLYEDIFPNDLLASEGWLNHRPFRLSDLDREIVRQIPQGGNWQDLPENIPSKRIEQIREMTKERGVVRTTYYGRLRPDQPAYTISTYFNRPGNGTNIHPFEGRTITPREAARLQSFPDSYFFIGSQAAIRKQIGNAVPPLLAYAIGKSIAKKVGLGNCVDIFSGAGGLSLGLELAGWKIILAVDNDKDISRTYRFNRPCSHTGNNTSERTVFVEGDLFLPEIYQKVLATVKKFLKKHGLDLLVGGPPCQGFSHAGWRDEKDRRNDLTSIYLKIVEDLKPKIVVMENVEGILTLKKGQIINDILLALKEIGYFTPGDPWVLCAEQFGVPQMRRRVFIVASRSKELLPDIPKPLFSKCLGRREKREQLPLFSEIAYPITVEEAFYGLKPLEGRNFGNCLNRNIRTEYSDWAKGLIPIEQMLERTS
jgi:DNA (cytosine-5)-methyltransferase 1